MSMKLQPVRGTHDILAEESSRRRAIIAKAIELGRIYGFEEISTPIFEFTEVFSRTLGDTSDVVNKEMYTFEDRGGESLTLRPELTAGIARAFITGGLQQNLPLKFFSTGPLFRYERPQKGRMRQFHQLDFEVLGHSDPFVDVELIALGSRLLKELGIHDVTLELNTLGCTESRAAYRTALVEYLSKYESSLSEDSRMRLSKNPLRVLDSKDEGDKKIVADAPAMAAYLTAEAQTVFDKVQNGLTLLKVPFTVNPRIVRGLDYYSHVVFEFISHSAELGSQNTVLGGGRYDGLIAQMGGPATPATGFAAGIERLLLASSLEAQKTKRVALVPISEDTESIAFVLSEMLRVASIPAELVYGGNVGKRMKKADKMGASFAVLVGGDELQENKVNVKNLTSGEQQAVPLDMLVDVIKAVMKDN